MKTIRAVAYGIDGGGMGHITRLCAIARWMRRYAPLCGVRLEVWFLSSAEGESLLYQEGFPSFKIPSKSVVKTAGLDKEAYLAVAKQWVWHSLALLRPDILLVDTFPNGSFQELFNALDLCPRRVFIYRPSKPEFAARPAFQAVLPAYDLIVVPSTRDDEETPAPPACDDRVFRAGPVLLRDRREMLSRDAARRVLGVPDDQVAVLITAGGGGDPEAQSVLHRSIDIALSFPQVHVLVAAGPLYRGRATRNGRVTWLNSPGLSELWNGVDVCLSAAGYNTVLEMLHAGVPSILRPQDKVADDQHLRAAWARDAGAALVAEHDDALRTGLESLLQEHARARLREAGRTLVPRNHAPDVAREVLALVLPEQDVEAAHDALDGPVLTLASRLGAGEQDLATLARCLGYRPASQLPAAPAPPTSRCNGRRPARSVAPGDALESALTDVLSAAAAAGVSMPSLLLVARAFSRIIAAESRPLSDVGQALASILEQFSPFADWPTVSAVLRLLAVERESHPAAIASELRDFALTLRRTDAVLPTALASLAREAASAGIDRTNAEVLRAAAESLCS